jgi:hypothetical protein
MKVHNLHEELMDQKIEHLKLIQAIITRMAGNLFFLKGWTITLVVGFLALIATKDVNPIFSLVPFLPIIIFWILDGYFLSMERRYIGLYKHVCKLDSEKIDFSLNADPYRGGLFSRNNWIRSAFSKTLLIFYVPVFLTILLVVYQLFC